MGLRGSTRATFLFARHVASLQSVPVTIEGHTLFVDLRDGLAHPLLACSPWSKVPWEVDEQEVMRRVVRPGDVVFDIGAHIGLHLVLLADLAGPLGRVHAFEPNARRLPALSATVARLGNTTLHGFGLGERAEKRTLFVPEDESMASLSDWTGSPEGTVRRSPCRVRRLDDLVAAHEVPPPDFIKCDVEGGELAVMAGARTVLDHPDAPLILYEANLRSARAFGLDIADACRYLASLRAADYSIHQLQPGGRLVRVSRLDPAIEHFNLLAVPAARRSRLFDRVAETVHSAA